LIHGDILEVLEDETDTTTRGVDRPYVVVTGTTIRRDYLTGHPPYYYPGFILVWFGAGG